MVWTLFVVQPIIVYHIMKQRLLRTNWILLGSLLITMLASLSYAHASVRGAGTQATTGCLVTFSETNEWGTIKAYYFDVENGRGKVFFKSGARLPKGTNVNFVATVSKGWEAGSWTVNDKVTKGRNRTWLNFRLEKDSKIALTCKRLKQYKISYASDPADGGTIKVYWKKQVGYYGDEVEEISIPNGGTVLDKTKVYIEARPKAGYRFDRYVINGKSQTGDSSDKNTYVLTPTEDLTIRGVFISTRPVTYAIHFAQPEHGHLKLFVGAQEIQPNATLERGTEVKVEATPDEGYELKSLKVNEQDILSAKKFAVEGESTVVATFEQKKPVTYAIHFAQPEHGHLKLFAGNQEIQPNAMLKRGTEVKVEATPDEGYELKSLKVNEQDILSAKKFTVERESTVVATFEQKKPVTYAIHFAQPAHGHLKLFAGEQEIQPNATLERGTEVKVEATPDEGYELKSLKVNEQDILSAKKFAVAGESTVVATFEQKKPVTYAIHFAQPEHGHLKLFVGNQELQPNAMLERGTEVKVEATPDEGYELKSLKVNEQDILSAKKFTVEGESTVVATFEQKKPVTYAIHFAQPAHGHLKLFVGEQEIQPNATLVRGTEVKVEATPDEGYELKSLKVNEQDILSAKKFTVEGESTVVATFEQKKPVTYAIHFAQPAHGHLKLFVGEQEIQPNATLVRGTEVKVEATPDEGYELKSLKVNEQDILSAKKFTVEGESTVVATFEQKTGVEEPDESLLLKVYPNPTDSYCIVSVPATYIGETAYLLGAGGELLRLLPLVQSEVTLDLAYLPIGTYLLKVGATDHSLTIIRK